LIGIASDTSSIPGVSVWLALGAVLAAAAAVIVALPFLRRPGLSDAEDRLEQPDARERKRLELVEERDRALAALKELEFDHRTGKVSDEDYRALVGPLRQRAAEALRALDTKPERVTEPKAHARR
jgi:SpoVK/Ycf46/Vps4 family AAA+-type ATPase